MQLIPISYFLQFRPDLSNLDDEKSKKRSKSEKQRKIETSKNEPGEEKADDWVNLKCYKYTKNSNHHI